MSRLRIQNFMIIGQGVPEISVFTHTHTNYFSNIDMSSDLKTARAHFTDTLNIIIDLSRKLNFLGMNQGYWSCKLCDPLAKSLSSVDYLI